MVMCHKIIDDLVSLVVDSVHESRGDSIEESSARKISRTKSLAQAMTLKKKGSINEKNERFMS